jgi:hypothetical protein
MDKKIIEKLKQDEHYYGDYGKQFLSNSDISVLLKNPKLLHQKKERTTAMVVGGYFHTAILEPDKLKRFKIIESSTRNTKKYKEMSDGEICLLQHEVDKIELMTEVMMDNNICRGLIKGDLEVPAVTEIFNYDSQAYIYSNLFGYEMLFIVIDKETHQIGLFDCSPDFYKSGEEKVRKATDAYDLFFKTEDFDSKQYLITKTL